MTELIRLNKRMAELGLCSRREADDWIGKGWVKVNGEIAVLGKPVSPMDRIEVAQAHGLCEWPSRRRPHTRHQPD